MFVRLRVACCPACSKSQGGSWGGLLFCHAPTLGPRPDPGTHLSVQHNAQLHTCGLGWGGVGWGREEAHREAQPSFLPQDDAVAGGQGGQVVGTAPASSDPVAIPPAPASAPCPPSITISSVPSSAQPSSSSGGGGGARSSSSSAVAAATANCLRLDHNRVKVRVWWRVWVWV